MPTTRKTVVDTDQQKAPLSEQIENSSDTSRSGTTRQALIDGEQSGEPEPFDFSAFKHRKSAQYG
jgi:antitoxin ParD1/3/4